MDWAFLVLSLLCIARFFDFEFLLGLESFVMLSLLAFKPFYDLVPAIASLCCHSLF